MKNTQIIRKILPEVADAIDQELQDQRNCLKMIASENYCSEAVRAAEGTLLTDKYSEGYPYHRFYAGCENVDRIEQIASDLACELFGAEYAFVQPHSGADANLCAYWAILNAKILEPYFETIKASYKNNGYANFLSKIPKTYNDLHREEWNSLRDLCHSQKLLALDYSCGGHLTHGYRHNISSQIFECSYYKVNPETGLLDYDELEKKALLVKPLILLAGYSAYPRALNFERFREIADKCGAVLMVDMAHFAGLVAGKVFEGIYNPVPYADIITSTTHKTLRGPRGGLILCKEWLKDAVNKSCPTVMGGPLQNMIAAKAVCFKEALSDDFKLYAQNVQQNAKILAESLKEQGLKVITGGTDNHMVLLDVSSLGITGRQAESALNDCGIICNRNAIPDDPNGPWYTSGLRLGTPALTTLGFSTVDFYKIGTYIAEVLKCIVPEDIETGKPSKSKYFFASPGDLDIVTTTRHLISFMLQDHPAYPDLD